VREQTAIAAEAATPSDGLEIDLREHQRRDGPVVVRTVESERRHRNARLIGVALLVVLNVADLVSTDAFLDAGVEEGNPVGAFLLSRGWAGWAKAILLLVLGWRVAKSPPRVGTTCALWFVAGVYTMAVLFNVLVLRAIGVL